MNGTRTHLWAMPVVAETYDGVLNDINGQHVETQHVQPALDKASDMDCIASICVKKEILLAKILSSPTGIMDCDAIHVV